MSPLELGEDPAASIGGCNLDSEPTPLRSCMMIIRLTYLSFERQQVHKIARWSGPKCSGKREVWLSSGEMFI